MLTEGEGSLYNPEQQPSKKEFAKLILDIVILIVRLNVEFKTRKFAERFPQISPNHISVAGFVLDLVFDATLVCLEKQGIKLSAYQKTLLLGLKAMIISFDMFDGALSRAKQIAGRPHDSQFGLKLDTSLDRLSIAADEITKALIVYYQDKNMSKLVPELVIIIGQLLTDPTPSIANARMKAQGKQDKKEGDSIIGFTGSQIYRKLHMMLINLYPQVKTPVGGVPTLLITGWIGIVGNISQAAKRKSIATNPEYPITLEPEVQQAAAESIRLLEVIRVITTTLGISVVTATAYLAWLRKQKST